MDRKDFVFLFESKNFGYLDQYKWVRTEKIPTVYNQTRESEKVKENKKKWKRENIFNFSCCRASFLVVSMRHFDPNQTSSK